MSLRGQSEGSGHRSSRAQSAVIGLVLLIGVVAAGSVAILTVGGTMIGETEQQAEQERIEQSFVELSHTMATTSTTGDTIEIVDFHAGEHGAISKTNTGSINITGEALDEPINVTIGAIEYEGDDGTKIAYQAGGVFRETGTETRIVSAPPIHYDMTAGVEDDTFNFPIVEVSNEEQLDSGGLTISHNSSERRGDVPLLEESTIEVNVTSEYCVGWENYFRQQTREGGDAIDEPCDEGTEGSVIAELGDIERVSEIEDGVTVFDEKNIDDADDGNEGEGTDPLFGNDFTEGQPPVLDEYIEEIVEQAADEEDGFEKIDEEDYDDLDDGKYYVKSISESDDFDFDLSDGNATLAVGGDIHFGDITVEGDNTLRIYANGGHDDGITLDGTVEHKDDSAEHIQLFGTSDMYFDVAPSNDGKYEGLVYIMSHEEKEAWDIDTDAGGQQCDTKPQAFFQGNDFDFNGAIVAYSVCAHSNNQNMDFGFADELANNEIQLLPEGYQLPPNVYYLNIAEHKVDVEN